MKKLSIVAMAVITSLSLNAANYVWGFTGDATGEIYQPGTSDYLENGTAFLFLGTVTASASEFDTSSATLVTTGGFDDMYYVFGNSDTENPSSSDLVSTSSGGQAYTLILVDQDGLASLDGYEGDYYLSTGTSAIREVPGATVTYYAEFFNNDIIDGASWSTMAAPTPPDPGPDPVPEPTSGLLVLLGMAGLALKRKKA